MTQEEMDSLDRGDIITHANGNSYIALQRRGKQLTAIREIDVSHPGEWRIFSRNPRNPRQQENLEKVSQEPNLAKKL